MSAIEHLKEFQSGSNMAVLEYGSEDRLLEDINGAKAVKKHEEEVYWKFHRLRERFITDPLKLSEVISAYQRYLQIRFTQYQDASGYASALSAGVITFDELRADAEKLKIILEENERRLDILLT
jgi:hypothetical protein